MPRNWYIISQIKPKWSFLWVNFRVWLPPSWDTIFSPTWHRNSSWPRFQSWVRNPVGSESSSAGRGPTGLRARCEIGVGWKIESCGPENGVSRWRRPNSDIYSQNYHFGLVYDVIYQFLGMEAKNYKYGTFCQQCIHPWPQVMPIFDREMPPGFTPAICLHRNFVYASILENRGDKSLDQNF